MDLQKIIKESLYFKYKAEEDKTKGFATNLAELGGNFSDVKVFVKPDKADVILSTVSTELNFPDSYKDNLKRNISEQNYGIAYSMLEMYAQQFQFLEDEAPLIHLVFSYFDSFKECALFFGLTQEQVFELVPEEKAAYEEAQAKLKAEAIAKEEAEKAKREADELAMKEAKEKEEQEKAKKDAEAEAERLRLAKEKEDKDREALEISRQAEAERLRIKAQEESNQQEEFEKAVNERVNAILAERLNERESAMSSDVTVDKVLEDNKELKSHVLTLEEKLDKLTSLIQRGEASFVPEAEEEVDTPLNEDEFIEYIDMIATRIPNSRILRPIILLYKSGEELEASYLLDDLLDGLSRGGVSFE